SGGAAAPARDGEGEPAGLQQAPCAQQLGKPFQTKVVSDEKTQDSLRWDTETGAQGEAFGRTGWSEALRINAGVHGENACGIQTEVAREAGTGHAAGRDDERRVGTMEQPPLEGEKCPALERHAPERTTK